MRLLVFTSLVAAITVSLVQSRCINIFDQSPNEAKCEDWWKQATDYSYKRNRAIRRCIILIQNKCSGYINIENKVTHEVGYYYMKWTIRISAYRPGIHSVGAAYTKLVTTNLCEKDDKGLGTCDLWWKIGKERFDENDLVKKCIASIIKYCPDNIKKISETKQQVDDIGKPKYVYTLVYEYKDGGRLLYKNFDN